MSALNYDKFSRQTLSCPLSVLTGGRPKPTNLSGKGRPYSKPFTLTQMINRLLS